MTLVAVWKAEGRIMAIADTRISRSPGNVLTEHGPKLLPIAIKCRQPGPSGFADQVVYSASICFAYSGSTLSALAAHALANILCSNLVSNRGTSPPSLAEIAFAIAGVSAEYMRDVGQLTGKDGLFSAIVFGFCPEQMKLRVFELKPQINAGQFMVVIEERHLSDIAIGGSAAASVVVIGSVPDLLIEAIDKDLSAAKDRGDVHSIIAFDAPSRALQSLIDRGADDSIGGSIQQGWATAAGFEVVAHMRPIPPRPPSPRNVGLFVLGFDTFDIQRIGGYMVSLTGR